MATTIRSTALDFNNIKNNLKTFLANQDDFKDYNFEASGLSNILDVLAYNTHMNALIANFALNESFLGTAQLRSSMVSLAEGIGYIPDTTTAAQAKLRISFNTSTTPRDTIIALPAFTKFSTSVNNVGYLFQTIEAFYATDDGTGFYEFKTASGSNQIPIYEGTLKTKTFLVGEYADNPVYIIPDNNIDAETAVVKVYQTSTSTAAAVYNNILNATSISAQSTVYILKEAPNGFFELSFGDGQTFGIAPSAGNRIEVQYLSTNGAGANRASLFTATNQLNSGGVSSPLSIYTYTNSVGGGAKESIESIRKNAPFQYATQNRMVTAVDYSSLILRNFSTSIKDIVSWGGEDSLNPEFGAVYVSILFDNDITDSTKNSIKLDILDLAAQLSVVSFNLRFADPVATYIELDTYFQYNPKLSDLTLNAIQDNVKSKINSYFDINTGGFKQSFRRSNMLSGIDDVSVAVLSSRAEVRMQQRFTPTTPNLISIINQLALGNITESQINKVVYFIVRKQYNEAANYMINNNLSKDNLTATRTTLSSVANSISQQLRFPVAIANPDDINYVINSNNFTYNGINCALRNKLNSNTLQIVNAGGTEIIVDNIGNYVPNTGVVTINFFNPSNVTGGDTQIKLSAVPANQSAVAPTRNDYLLYDPNRSTTTAVIVSALN
jgi:hypothetical protein